MKIYAWDVVNEAGSNTELWDEIGDLADSFSRMVTAVKFLSEDE